MMISRWHSYLLYSTLMGFKLIDIESRARMNDARLVLDLDASQHVVTAPAKSCYMKSSGLGQDEAELKYCTEIWATISNCELSTFVVCVAGRGWRCMAREASDANAMMNQMRWACVSDSAYVGLFSSSIFAWRCGSIPSPFAKTTCFRLETARESSDIRGLSQIAGDLPAIMANDESLDEAQTSQTSEITTLRARKSLSKLNHLGRARNMKHEVRIRISRWRWNRDDSDDCMFSIKAGP